MRILHVISNLEVGGAEKMVVTIANASVNAGHAVGVCLLVNKGPLVDQLDNRVRLHEVSRRWRLDWKALKTFASVARQYDLLHVHLKHNVKYVYVVSLLFGTRVPVLLHDHSAEVLVDGVPKTKLPVYVLWWLRKQYYLAVSEPLMQWAVKNFGLDPLRAWWIDNAIECKLPLTTGTIEPNAINLLLVSNFRRIKNIEFAVDLVAEMVKRGLPAKLHIIGKSIDRNYFDEILNKIRALRLTEIVKIREDVTDVSSIIPNYTLGLHCSRAETGPLVLLEFMCSGLPFVTYSNGSVSDRLKTSYPELVLSDFRISHWIERIQYLILDLNSYNEALKQYVNSEYSVGQYSSEMNRLYQHLLGY